MLLCHSPTAPSVHPCGHYGWSPCCSPLPNGTLRLWGALSMSWPHLHPCCVPVQLLERLEGSTLGTFSTPAVTHRKLSACGPGPEGSKVFSCLCGDRARAAGGFRWVSQQALGTESPAGMPSCWLLLKGAMACQWPGRKETVSPSLAGQHLTLSWARQVALFLDLRRG